MGIHRQRHGTSDSQLFSIVTDERRKRKNVPLADEFKEHPSLRSLAEGGHTVLIF